MPELDGFQGELAAALEKRASSLAADVLPTLRESFKLFHSLFSNLYNLLYRESLIQEDPYQHDRKLSELVLPSREPIPDSERMETLSRRLAELQGQLEFLASAYQFDLEFLSLERLKLLSGLVRFIDWSNLASSSPDANTAVLAEALSRIKLGTDKVSAGIVGDSSTQLAALSARLLSGLQSVAAWQREARKLELRRLLQRPELAKILETAPEQALPRLQRACRQLEPGRPFHPALAREVLAEDRSEQGPRLRAEALARLAVAQRQAAGPPPVDYRALLLEAVRLMLPLHAHLGEALARLEANREQREGRRRGWRGRLRALFAPARDPGAVLEIRQFDNATGVARPTRVDFPRFAEKVRRLKALLEALSSSTSAASGRLRAAPEQELYEFLNKSLGELQGMYRVLEGLDAYFKSGRKDEVKGIKIELAAIKNGLVRANRQRYEYASRRQEERQRREMGLA